MNCGIAIDKYKRDIFEERVTGHDFEYTVRPGLTGNTLFISVDVEDERVAELTKLIRETNTVACRRLHN